MATNTNKPVGVIVIARHGDRTAFYQNMTDYTASDTVLTPLGMQQEYELGAYLRSLYVDQSSPNAVAGLAETIDDSQVVSVVDGGGEGAVIANSAQAFWQGFYPPTASATTTLANGTTITAPLSGYQYVQMDTLLPATNNSLEGFTNCPNFAEHTSALFNSPTFADKQAETTNFLAQLGASGLLGNRTVALNNAYNAWDYMNVQSIHNATYAQQLAANGGPSVLARMRDIANWQQYYSFTDPDPSSVGMVAINNFLPLIIDSLATISNPANQMKLVHYQISYKPFLSLFNATDMAATTSFAYPQGMVDYAAAVTLEVRVNTAGTGHDVRFNFKNGTNDAALAAYPLFGSSSVDYDLDSFVTKLAPYQLRGELAWCRACNSTSPSCLTALAAASATASPSSSAHSSSSGLSNAAAGGIGASVAVAVAALAFALAWALGFVTVGKRHHLRFADERRAQQAQADMKAKEIEDDF